ncbi:MAG TPA: hypothetical protein VHJ34_15790 [Actinomycetota bacterium]|nr:hypothetical protein [Actinomycetota bacterium]
MAAYLAVSATIARSLVVTGQLRGNRLGAATAAIFLTCGLGHGAHALHLATAASHHAAGYDWHIGVVDVVTAGVGIWYWSLRSSYGALLARSTLFDDLSERRRSAMEINDDVVQGLALAKHALARGDDALAHQAICESLDAATRIAGDLLHDVPAGDSFVRAKASELVATRERS